jgi:hypothetical protein
MRGSPSALLKVARGHRPARHRKVFYSSLTSSFFLQTATHLKSETLDGAKRRAEKQFLLAFLSKSP